MLSVPLLNDSTLEDRLAFALRCAERGLIVISAVGVDDRALMKLRDG